MTSDDRVKRETICNVVFLYRKYIILLIYVATTTAAKNELFKCNELALNNGFNRQIAICFYDFVFLIVLQYGYSSDVKDNVDNPSSSFILHIKA